MPLNKVTSQGAMRTFLIIELLRSTGEKEFPAQLMAIFFWIAAHNGCKQDDLVRECNISRSSVSRCVTWLGPRHRLEHRSGLKLVRRERDPDNHRGWLLYLTPKGEIFTSILDKHWAVPLREGNPLISDLKTLIKEDTFDFDTFVENERQDLG